MNIEMAQFVDYVLANGPSKIMEIKRHMQGSTDKAPSIYARLRAKIVETFTSGKDVEELRKLTPEDRREHRIYPIIIRGYDKFLRDDIRRPRFAPPLADYSFGDGPTIRVDPEIGLEIDGKPCIIKLYFRSDPISPQRIMVTNELLAAAFSETWPKATFAVLDVRRARLYKHRSRPDVKELLKVEAMSFGALAEVL